MKIRNNSNKVIGINNAYLLPDQEGEFPDVCEGLPGIQALVKNGMITVTKEQKKPYVPVEIKVEKEEPEEEPKEEPQEEEPVVKPKRTRKKKEEVTE